MSATCSLVVYRWCSQHQRVEKGRCSAPKGHPQGAHQSDMHPVRTPVGSHLDSLPPFASERIDAFRAPGPPATSESIREALLTARIITSEDW